jgi:hypothetical protein
MASESSSTRTWTTPYDVVGLRPLPAPGKNARRIIALPPDVLLPDYYQAPLATRSELKMSKEVKICGITLANERFVVHHNFPIRLLTNFITSLRQIKLTNRENLKPELQLPQHNIDLYYLETICDWLVATADLPRSKIYQIIFTSRDLTDMLWLRDTLAWLELTTAAQAIDDQLPQVIKTKTATTEDVDTFFQVTPYSHSLVDALFNAMALHESQGRLVEGDQIMQLLEEKHHRIYPRYLRSRIDHRVEGAIADLEDYNQIRRSGRDR